MSEVLVVEPVVLPPDVWERRDDPEIRNLIVLAYWPMLTRVVGRLRQGLPGHVRVEEGDLRSYALLRLYRAIEKFDPDKGVDFDRYASNSVRGGFLDGLRKMDWAPRSLRSQQRDYERACKELRTDLHRAPTDTEVEDHLGWECGEASSVRWQVDVAFQRSLDEIRDDYGQDRYAVVASQEGTPEALVLESMESHENDRTSLLSGRVAEFISTLAPQTQAYAALYFFLGVKKQSDIADILGISVPRVTGIRNDFLTQAHGHFVTLLG